MLAQSQAQFYGGRQEVRVEFTPIGSETFRMAWKTQVVISRLAIFFVFAPFPFFSRTNRETVVFWHSLR